MAASKRKNQYDGFERDIVEITEDLGSLDPEYVKNVSNAYNAIYMAAQRFAKDNQSVSLSRPEMKSGTSRTKLIDVTGENSEALIQALLIELNNALSKKDRENLGSYLSVTNRKQRYNTVRARLDHNFVKTFTERFKSSGTEITQIGDGGMYEIAVPMGSMVRGAGKNHTRQVDAWDAARRAVDKEQKRAAAEREADRKYVEEGGVSFDEFEQMSPKEQKTALKTIDRTHRNKQFAASKGVRETLLQSDIDKAASIREFLDEKVRIDPTTPLPEADIRKLSPVVARFRRLYQRAEGADADLNNPDVLKDIWIADLKKRKLKREITEEYYSDPANLDDPYVQDRLIHEQKVKNREEKAVLRERERTPGTEEYRQYMSRRLMLNDVGADEKEKILKTYIKQNPKSRLAKEFKRKRREAVKNTTRKVAGRITELERSIRNKALTGILGFAAIIAATTLRLLSAVLKIGDVVRDNAANAQEFALNEEQMRTYSLIESNLKIPKGTYSKLFGAIQGNLSNLDSGGLDSWIDKTAIISRRNNFKSVYEAIDYSLMKPGTSVMTVLKESFNDAFIAAYNRQTGIFDSDSFTRALATNAKAFSTKLPEAPKLFNALGEWYLKSASDETRKKVEEAAKKGGDPYTILEKDVAGREIKLQQEITPAAILARSEEVAKTFDRVRTTFETIRDGLLTNILAAVEPLAGYLYSLLKYFLGFLNTFEFGPFKSPFHGQLTGVITTMNEGIYEQNKDSEAKVAGFKLLAEARLKAAAEEIGYSPALAGFYANDFKNHYIIHPGSFKTPTFEEITDFIAKYDDLIGWQDKDKELKEQEAIYRKEGLGSLSYRPVTGVTALEGGRKVFAELASSLYSLAQDVERILNEASGHPGYDIPTALDRMYEAQINMAANAREKLVEADELDEKAADLAQSDYAPDRGRAETYKKQATALRKEFKDIETEANRIFAVKETFYPLVMNDGKYRRGEVELLANRIAKKEGNEMSAELVILNELAGKMGYEALSRMVSENKLNISIEMDSEATESTIYVKDLYGKQLGSVRVPGQVLKNVRVERNGIQVIDTDYERALMYERALQRRSDQQ
jgi:hypothetical protein